MYEKVLRIPYYGIYEVTTQKLEMYHLDALTYYPMEANARGHYEIKPLGVELGLWDGTYQNQTQRWLRWWDVEGNLLLIGNERAEIAQSQLRECALNLLREGMDVEKVARLTGLSPEEVSAIAL